MKQQRHHIAKTMAAAVLIANDDFGGGTDRQGHVIKGFHNVRNWWSVDFAVFLSEKISDRTRTPTQPGLNGQTQTHLYADTMFKF